MTKHTQKSDRQTASNPKFLFFKPYLKTVVWGGENLQKLYNSELIAIGEA